LGRSDAPIMAMVRTFARSSAMSSSRVSGMVR
jgi:hypothetical protein